MRYARKILVGNPERKKALGRPRRGWKNNNETDLVKIKHACVDWIDLTEDKDRWRALVNTYERRALP
jgi:hypothetical protein